VGGEGLTAVNFYNPGTQSGAMNLTPSYKAEHRTVILQYIRTKIRETGVAGVILGLSGGLDSAVTAALAAEALGTDRVKCLIMPYDPDGELESVKHAVDFATQFGIEYELIPITDAVDEVMDLANLSDIQMKVNTTASGNVKARIRMAALYYYANLENLLVLGTSNKSELLVGYFTKYGDGGTDAMPIGDLYKTQVFELARELDIPDSIASKPPSAGLVAGQTDEHDLGVKYADLDRILMGIERWLPLEDIADLTRMDLETVRRVQNMVYRSAHKRYLGMIPKIGLRTPGLDWRENTSLLSFPHETLG
jgi:NAD+ synthase